MVGPSKVKACKSFVFTQKFLIVENKEHLFGFVINFYFQFYLAGIEAFMKFNNELNAMNILVFWFYEINPWTFASESI